MQVRTGILVALSLTLVAGCQARGGEKGPAGGQGADRVAGTGMPQTAMARKPGDAPAAKVRAPAVAGAFYPADRRALKAMVEGFLSNLPPLDPGGDIVAVMAPHAGYVYSGQVAAYTHKALQKADFDTVVIIGHDAYRGVVAHLCSAAAFETPLGRVPVDRDLVSRLEAYHPGLVEDCRVQARDHTVEVQLPFLQVSGKSFKIVPAMFGEPTLDNARIFAEAIRKSAGRRKMMVFASTDMSHYPPYDAARALDLSTLKVLKALDPARLYKHLHSAESSGKVPGLRTAMCASGGVMTAMMYARAVGADRVQVLKYANAGDVPKGDKGRVVGYGAALFVRSKGQVE